MAGPKPPLEPDFDGTQYWNTPLGPEEEHAFQQWASANDRLRDLYDYDMRGAWQEGISPDQKTQHWPDTYKKPNHPTFSNESIYHGVDGHMGGRWDHDETGSETLLPYDPRFAEGGEVDREPEPGLDNRQMADEGDVRRMREFPGWEKFIEENPELARHPDQLFRSRGFVDPGGENYHFRVPQPNKLPGQPNDDKPTEYWQRIDPAERPMSSPKSSPGIGPLGRQVLLAQKGGAMVQPYDPDDETEYAPDALESADQQRIEARRIRDIGRAETMRQLDDNEFEIRRQEAASRNRMREKGWDEPEHTVEQDLEEQARAAKRQRELDDWNRNYRPPPGGVPGYQDGGVVLGDPYNANPLLRMEPFHVKAIADGVPGYEHLQPEAEELVRQDPDRFKNYRDYYEYKRNIDAPRYDEFNKDGTPNSQHKGWREIYPAMRKGGTVTSSLSPKAMRAFRVSRLRSSRSG